MSGGLFDPLGMNPARPGRAGALPPAVVLGGLALAALAALAAVSWLHDDGDRGRPVAVAPIEHLEAAPKPPAPAPASVPAGAPAAEPAASASLPAVRDDQEVEIQNGVRIIRPRRAAAPAQGAQILPVKGSGPGR